MDGSQYRNLEKGKIIVDLSSHEISNGREDCSRGSCVYEGQGHCDTHLTYPVLKKLMTRLVRLRKQFLGVKCIIEFKVGRCFSHFFSLL